MSRNKKSSWQNHATPTLRHHSQPMFKASKLPCICIAWSPKSWVSFKDFSIFCSLKKKETTLLYPFFLLQGDSLFFRVFWLPPGSERQQNLQANESDCECFMGLCDRFGGENHKSLIFWVWPLTGCQWSQDHYICSRGFLCKPSFTTVVEGGAHTQLIFQTQKSLNKNLSLGSWSPIHPRNST